MSHLPRLSDCQGCRTGALTVAGIAFKAQGVCGSGVRTGLSFEK